MMPISAIDSSSMCSQGMIDIFLMMAGIAILKRCVSKLMCSTSMNSASSFALFQITTSLD